MVGGFATMVSFSVRECHMLEGATFVMWKCRLQDLLEALLFARELWYIVDKGLTPPTNPKDLAKHTKKSATVKHIVLARRGEGSLDPSYYREEYDEGYL